MDVNKKRLLHIPCKQLLDVSMQYIRICIQSSLKGKTCCFSQYRITFVKAIIKASIIKMKKAGYIFNAEKIKK